jgi:hypothetical protein
LFELKKEKKKEMHIRIGSKYRLPYLWHEISVEIFCEIFNVDFRHKIVNFLREDEVEYKWRRRSEVQ